jgi:MFS family permease
VSEAALDAHIALARPWCLTPAFAIVTIGCIAVAAGGRGILYLAVFLTMFGYGANLSILPAMLHERYGQRHFGSIWAFSQTAMVVASSVFATGFAAQVYEKHATLGANGLQTCLVRLHARFCVPLVFTRLRCRETRAISRRSWDSPRLRWAAPASRAFSLRSLPTSTKKWLLRAPLKSRAGISPHWACTRQRRKAQRRCDI